MSAPTTSASPLSPSQSGDSNRRTSEKPSVEAAVDGDVRSAHVRGPTRAEECHEIAELARFAEPPSRDPRDLFCGRAGRPVELTHPCGCDASRADRVDRYPLRPQLVGKRLHVADDAG